MGKPQGSIQIKSDHPRFAEVCKALGAEPTGKNSVYVSPDKAIYASLVGEGPMADPPKEMSREDKVTRIRLALSCKETVREASEGYDKVKEALEMMSVAKAKANADFRLAMTGFDAVVPSGHSFRFGGTLYTHIHGDLVSVNDSADDFDVEPPKAEESVPPKAEESAPVKAEESAPVKAEESAPVKADKKKAK